MDKDSLLFYKITQNSKSAYEELFHLYYSKLCLFAYDLCRSKELAEDIVQDFFLKIWNEKKNIKINTSVKSYFFQSIYNRVINFINHKKVHNLYLSNYLNDNRTKISVNADNNNYPLANLIQQELEGKITEAIDSLPPQCKSVFYSSRFEDLKYDEISKKMNISVNSVKTHMKNALQKLRTALEEYLPE